jgi:two-component system CheB/CheR fusion protein
MPLSLLVNDSLQLVHAWGPTQQWLRVTPGAASTETARMLPADLAPLAAQVMRAVLRDGMDMRRGPTPVALPDGSRVGVLVHGSPLRGPAGEAYALLSIEAQPPAAGGDDLPGSAASPGAADHALLESELAEMRHNLQATITELEATNEELQATNEELMSSNEELQSTNEELQSVNEELYTVNAEYNAKLEALNAMNADLESVCQSTGIATLFLDADLALKRYTPEAMQLFRLRESDLGRPITDLASLLRYPELSGDLLRALQSNQVIEREVQGPGPWYLARAVGYAEHGHVPRRVVVSFIDISLVRDARRLQGLIDSVPARAAVLDPQGSIRMVNRAWVEHAQNRGDPTLAGHGVGVNYLATLARAGDDTHLYALRRLQAVLEGREKAISLRYPAV